MRLQALVLDFGGPVLLTPFEVVRAFERRTGLVDGTFEWTGPFNEAKDPLWRAMLANELTEREYWAARADEVAAVTGRPGLREMMAQLYPVEEIGASIRRQASETVRSARAAGLQTAVLTNDLAMFYDDQWIRSVGFLDEVDGVIDGRWTDVLKPDPAAYRHVMEMLGVDAERALFVDDQPRNVEGARAIGMLALQFDVTKPADSYREVSQLMGLSESGQCCSIGWQRGK